MVLQYCQSHCQYNCVLCLGNLGSGGNTGGGGGSNDTVLLYCTVSGLGQLPTSNSNYYLQIFSKGMIHNLCLSSQDSV